jgi:two-component system, LytTR family, sensor kinase
MPQFGLFCAQNPDNSMLIIQNRTRLLLHLGFWLVLFLFFTGFLSLSLSLDESVLLSGGNFMTLATLFYVHIRLVDRYFERKRFAPFFIISLLWFSGVSALRFLLHVLVLKKYLVHDGVLTVSPEGRLGLFVLTTSFMFAVFAVIVRLLQNQYRRELENLNLLAEKQAAELQLLKAQINPHFLFNALNNVYSLVEAKSDLAGPMLVKLSNLLRYVIYESQKPHAELSNEIREINNFMELYVMQFAQRPRIEFFIEGQPDNHYLEPMLLIPLLENCFKHANLGKTNQAFCQLELKVLPNGQLSFTTRNSFDPLDQQKDSIGGVGLENMRRRLQLRYPDNHLLEVSQHAGIFEVLLQLPLTQQLP